MRAAAALLLGVLATGSFAQEVAPENDPLVQQRRLAMVLRQTTQLYEAGEYQAGLDRLNALPEGAARDLSVLNLRGAILTKMEQYDEAREIFEAILATEPGFFPAAFNLGEVYFLQGNYEGALRIFGEIRRRDPRNELVRFKLLLCHLQLGQDDQARRLADNFIPAGSTPAWYYAQAMMARRDGDQAAAARHLHAARNIYGEDSCKLFEESIGNVNF